MADWYDRALDRVGQSILNLNALTLPKLVPVDSSYVFSQTHEFLSDVLAGSRVASSVALTGVTFGVSSEGWLDADDTTIISPTTGKIITGFVFYDDLGSEATSPLLFHASSGVGLPFTVPTTASIPVVFSGSGIARL